MLIIFGLVSAIAVIAKFYRGFLPDLIVAIPALLGTAISILLSFRVGQSYDRWWEARKVWGLIVNDSRTVVLQLSTFLPNSQQELIKKMAYRQIAWCYVLSKSLRKQAPLAGAEKYLSPEDISAVEEHVNKPLGLIQLNINELKLLRDSEQLDVFERIQLDSTLNRLVAYMGAAERIKNTVFPVTYTLFLRYLLYLFLISLAISLKDVNMIFEIPILMVVAFAFFLIEGSATQLQDPFENRPTDTSMTFISEVIEVNIRQMLGEKGIQAPQLSSGYYQL